MAKDKKAIEKLWIRYVEGRATLDEINALFASLQDESLDENHTDWAQRAAMHADSDLPTDSERENAVWRGLLTQADGLAQSLTQTSARPPKRDHVLRRWAWAASITVVLGVAAYLAFNSTEPSSAPALAANEILPGTAGAILTLSDGTQVVLDSLGNGLIAHPEGAVLSLTDNNLTYQADDSAGNQAMYHTMSTPKGRQFSLTLPDGSRVWLNAASSIHYPTVFTGAERRVEITGEAYFEVAKNPKMPFRVTINGHASVEVLGTRFNVHAYELEAGIYTTLLEGAVRVQEGEEQVTLQPGQQAQILKGIHVADGVDVNGIIAWKNGFFNFEGLPLRQVMRQLERWYDIEVVYQGDVPDVVFRGKVYRNLPFEDVCYILQKMGVNFTLTGRTLTITE